MNLCSKRGQGRKRESGDWEGGGHRRGSTYEFDDSKVVGYKVHIRTSIYSNSFIHSFKCVYNTYYDHLIALHIVYGIPHRDTICVTIRIVCGTWNVFSAHQRLDRAKNEISDAECWHFKCVTIEHRHADSRVQLICELNFRKFISDDSLPSEKRQNSKQKCRNFLLYLS